MTRFETVNDYMKSLPSDTQKVLKQVRSTIKKLMPKANEEISYGIPTLNLNGKWVIYFAGYKKHISIYPAPRGNAAFKKELSAY